MLKCVLLSTLVGVKFRAAARDERFVALVDGAREGHGLVRFHELAVGQEGVEPGPEWVL